MEHGFDGINSMNRDFLESDFRFSPSGRKKQQKQKQGEAQHKFKDLEISEREIRHR